MSYLEIFAHLITLFLTQETLGDHLWDIVCKIWLGIYIFYLKFNFLIINNYLKFPQVIFCDE